MSVKQQCFEHIIVGALMPLFNAKITPHQYASVEKRGQVACMRTIQKWVCEENRRKANAKKYGRRYTGKCSSFVKLDVTQCFPSITTATVMCFLRHDITKNDELLWAVEAILKTHEVGGRGLVIGSLLSQFVCNYLLSYVYRYAMALHVEQDGKQVKAVTHGLFFMDDILMTGSNPDHLREAVSSVIKYAKDTIGLTVKPNWHVKTLDDEPIDMMGYVVHADGHVTIRARIFLRTRRAYLRANRRTIDVKCARRLMAYNGYLVHTATHELRERLNVKKIRRIARRIIRKHDRKEKMLHDERYPVYRGAGSCRVVGTSA